MQTNACVTLLCSDAAPRRRLELSLLCGRFNVSETIMPSAKLILYFIGHHLAGADEQHLAEIKARHKTQKLIVLSEDRDLNESHTPAKTHADDIILDCFNSAALLARLHSLLNAPLKIRAETSELVGESAAIRTVRETIELVAPSEVTLLITGETGTGKECAARMAHRLSKRSRGPFMAVNCAAIPDALLEGELFGYERGAFTGALKAYPGKLKLSDHGTLVLDEVGDLTLAGQAKVLRAIETREIYRLGGISPERFDARIVAVTNADLAVRMTEGGFRKDLYYRLAVAQVNMPSLRERREDISVLAQHFLVQIAAKSHRNIECFDAAALALLCGHNWPGNVRELINVVEMALLAHPGPVIPASALSLNTRDLHRASAPASRNEKEYLLQTLESCGGNKSLAAKKLNWSRMTLYRKLELYQLASPPATVTTHVTV